MYCSNCGKLLPDGSRFCYECGQPVSPDAVKPVNETVKNVVPPYGSPKKRSRVWLWILIGVLALAAVGTGLLFLVKAIVSGRDLGDWRRTKVAYLDQDLNVTSFTEYQYDETGNMIRQIGYDGDGNVETTRIISYDDGSWIRQKEYDEDGELSFTAKAEYDENGNLVKVTIFEDDKKYWFTYQYDEQNRMIGSKDYDDEGNLSGRYQMRYDDDDHMTEQTYYDKDGTVSSVNKYEYDDDGNRVLMSYYDGDGNLTVEYRYYYDEDGNLTENNYFSSYGDYSFRTKYKYQFDEAGNIIRESRYDDDGNFIGRTNYEWEYFPKAPKNKK